MRLVICVNHSYPHCGGSEKVVQQVAEQMVDKFNHECVVISRSIKSKIHHNGVKLIPCAPSGLEHISQLRKQNPDFTFVYSDCFSYWSDILKQVDSIPGRKGIALVGMNHMISHTSTMSLFLKEFEKFSVITHSDNYIDYQTCKNKMIPAQVIPNGVDLKEFESVAHGFRKKYKVKTKHMILCVSNFFPGKGQDQLVNVLKVLKRKRQADDFTVVFISTTVNFFVAKHCALAVKGFLGKAGFPFKFLVDIPREDVLSAFAEADVFAFPSQKEVAPLVVLESMASGTPWVSLPIGNVQQLAGGMLAPSSCLDVRGHAKYGKTSYEVFASHLNDLLNDESKRQELGELGKNMIKSTYNWGNIVDKYNEVFSHG